MGEEFAEKRCEQSLGRTRAFCQYEYERKGAFGAQKEGRHTQPFMFCPISTALCVPCWLIDEE
jgi:hypothetical protein